MQKCLDKSLDWNLLSPEIIKISDNRPAVNLLVQEAKGISDDVPSVDYFVISAHIFKLN